MTPTVVDMVISAELYAHPTIAFELHGEIGCQNGWRLAFRNRARPYLYDPNKRAKDQLRATVKAALEQFGVADFPVYTQQQLKLQVEYHMVNPSSKDIDNMIKFLQDALEGVLYDNDRNVWSVHATKRIGPAPITKVSIGLL